MDQRLIPISEGRRTENELALEIACQVEGAILRGFSRADERAFLANHRLQRYSVINRLLAERDESILRVLGEPDVIGRFRRERRGIYFDYILQFRSEARATQSNTLEHRVLKLRTVLGIDFKLHYLVLGMAFAGVLHFFHFRKAREVAEYFVERALPLVTESAASAIRA